MGKGLVEIFSRTCYSEMIRIRTYARFPCVLCEEHHVQSLKENPLVAEPGQ